MQRLALICQVCHVEHRTTAIPPEWRRAHRRKESGYGIQLKEKQKLKMNYGLTSDKATSGKEGSFIQARYGYPYAPAPGEPT